MCVHALFQSLLMGNLSGIAHIFISDQPIFLFLFYFAIFCFQLWFGVANFHLSVIL